MFFISAPVQIACVETWGSWFERHSNQASFLDKNHPTIKHVIYDKVGTITACGYYGIDELLEAAGQTSMSANNFLEVYKDPWKATATVDQAIMKRPLSKTFDCKWVFHKKSQREPVPATWKYEDGLVTITFNHTDTAKGGQTSNTWQSINFFDEERSATLAKLK